jgi:Type IV pili methyl-accepting chemotaxis transducer N-term
MKSNVMRKLALAGAVVSASLTVLSGPVSAAAEEVASTPENVGKRIAIAGRQRMLAEGMAKSVCYFEAGVDTEASLRDLYTMWNLYGWYHRGIYIGNVQLDLFQEKNERIKRMWTKVDGVWSDLSQIHLESMAGNKLPANEFERLMNETTEVALLNSDLVSVVGSVYSRYINEQGQGSALLIDLYERQRMLAHKLSKDVCLVQRGFQLDQTRSELDETLKVFTLSLDAFVDGMPSVSVPPAPTSDIRSLLVSAQKHWEGISPLADHVVGGGGLSAEEMSQFRSEMNAVVGEMTKAINRLVAYEASKS